MRALPRWFVMKLVEKLGAEEDLVGMGVNR
jgi:hypothetical protein